MIKSICEKLNIIIVVKKESFLSRIVSKACITTLIVSSHCSEGSTQYDNVRARNKRHRD